MRLRGQLIAYALPRMLGVHDEANGLREGEDMTGYLRRMLNDAVRREDWMFAGKVISSR